jgi:hypothetical protein
MFKSGFVTLAIITVQSALAHKGKPHGGMGPKGDFLKCQACGVAVNKLSKKIESAEFQQTVKDTLIPICENPQFGVMQADEVCPGMIELNSGPVFTLLSRDIFSQLRICNELLGFCSKPGIETYEIEDFTARVLADKPTIIQNDDYLNKLYE